MESDESAGGAAQLVVPQRARGCAAVLCFLAVRLCKAPPFARWEAPVHQALSAPSCLRWRRISWALTLGHACIADR